MENSEELQTTIVAGGRRGKKKKKKKKKKKVLEFQVESGKNTCVLWFSLFHQKSRCIYSNNTVVVFVTLSGFCFIVATLIDGQIGQRYMSYWDWVDLVMVAYTKLTLRRTQNLNFRCGGARPRCSYVRLRSFPPILVKSGYTQCRPTCF